VTPNEHGTHMAAGQRTGSECPRVSIWGGHRGSRTGTILSEGCNKTSRNPTWHGEIDAINTLAASNVGIKGKNIVL